MGGAQHFGTSAWMYPAAPADTAGFAAESAAAVLSPAADTLLSRRHSLAAVRTASLESGALRSRHALDAVRIEVDAAMYASLTPPPSSVGSPASLPASSRLDREALASPSGELPYELEFPLSARLSVSLDSPPGGIVGSPSTPPAVAGRRGSGDSGVELTDSSDAGISGTATKKNRNKSPTTGKLADGGVPLVCANCGTTKTARWRISSNGENVCNACGIYERSRGVPRPREMLWRNQRRQDRTLAAYLKWSKPVEGHCSCTCGGCSHAPTVASAD